MNPIHFYISGCGDATCYIGCPLGDFNISNYLVTISTILTPSERDTLRNAIRPGKYEEFPSLFEKPIYIDTTYSSANTIEIIPYSTEFQNLWSGNKIVVRDYKEEPFGQPPSLWRISLSGYILGEF